MIQITIFSHESFVQRIVLLFKGFLIETFEHFIRALVDTRVYGNTIIHCLYITENGDYVKQEHAHNLGVLNS